MYTYDTDSGAETCDMQQCLGKRWSESCSSTDGAEENGGHPMRVQTNLRPSRCSGVRVATMCRLWGGEKIERGEVRGILD